MLSLTVWACCKTSTFIMYFIKYTVSDDPLTWRYALSLIKDSVRADDRVHFILKAYATPLYLAHESIILLKVQATVLLLHYVYFKKHATLYIRINMAERDAMLLNPYYIITKAYQLRTWSKLCRKPVAHIYIFWINSLASKIPFIIILKISL